MAKIDYIIRENEIPLRIYGKSVYDIQDTDEILDDYPYIKRSMNKENFYIKHDICSVFTELLYENKVVGFATYNQESPVMSILTEYYILPEFREKKILYEEIIKNITFVPEFGILEPSRDLVELLIEYSFAEKVTEDIVVSGIDFYFDEFEAKSDKRKDLSSEENLSSNYYDLGICSTILFDGNEIIYHNSLENDLRKYGKREKLNKKYFKNMKKLFSKNGDDYEIIIQKLKEEMPRIMSYDEIIGEGEGLSSFMQQMVDNELVSYEQALKIRQDLISEYESGKITDKNINEKLMWKVINEQKDITSSDSEILAEFNNILADKEEISEDLIKAVLSDDLEQFENIIINAMSKDEEFSDRFTRFMNMVNDDYDQLLPDNEFLDLDDLGLNLNSPYPVAEMMWGSDKDKYKLDDTFYGKDYPMSHDNHMYTVLTLIKKGKSLEFALDEEEMDGAMTPHAIESLLRMQGFIDDKVTYKNWDEFAHDSLTVDDLKWILRKNNLKVSGRKQELIDRIAENQIPLDEVKYKVPTVTAKGEEFLENNRWIEFYNEELYDFDFNDFVKYLDTHEGKFLDVTYSYLEEHLKLADKEGNPQYMKDCIYQQEMIEDIKDELKNYYYLDFYV